MSTQTLPKPRTTYLRCIAIEEMIIGQTIVLILSMSYYKCGNVENEPEIHLINIDEFYRWLDEKDKTEITEGWGEDAVTERITPEEYMRSDGGKWDYKEYLIEKNLTRANDFSF